MAISDRILLLNNGKIEQQGTPQSMYETPDTLFTAEFMGSNNRLPARVLQRGGKQVQLDINGARLQASARGNAGAGAALIRVEEIKISVTPADNAIELPLLACMYLGDRFECLFKGEGGEEISVRAYSKYRLEPGRYWLQLPADKLWVF
jgi:iron(III) transport system ATP-binding protein